MGLQDALPITFLSSEILCLVLGEVCSSVAHQNYLNGRTTCKAYD